MLIVTMAFPVLCDSVSVYAAEGEADVSGDAGASGAGADSTADDAASTDTYDSAAKDESIRYLERSAPENLNQTGYDIVYVIDNSRSVWSQQSYRNQAFKKITNLAVGSDMNIGVVYFADHLYKTMKLTSVQTEEGSKKVLDTLNMTEQDNYNIDTNIGNALEEAVKMFNDQDETRQRIVVLFSDGINENLAGEQSYTDRANAKTREQVQKLKNMNASIFCVYLQKQRNDEEYLKQLVNYFSGGDGYTQERFAKVEESRISDLTKTFTKVFYAIQDNMRHREIELDSSGTDTFYVPCLGIKELRVFLDGKIQEGTIKPAGESPNSKWPYESATFAVYTDPVPGNWSIDVKSSDLSDVYGTITYHVNLLAGGEVAKLEEDDKYQLTVRFYNENGEEIAIDHAVSVAVYMNYNAEDGSSTSVPLNMTVNDGCAKSDPFEMTAYGDYSYTVDLTYSEFVDLKYTLSGMGVDRTAPVTTSIESGKFQGEKTASGYQFSIAEEKLWKDLEGEEVWITRIVQKNAANYVEAVKEDGYVVVTAAETGDIDFELQIEDASGMTAKVSVQGSVSDRGIARMIRSGICICLILIGLAVAAVELSRLKKVRDRENREEELKSYFDKWEQQKQKADRICASLDNRIRMLKEEIDSFLGNTAGSSQRRTIVDLKELIDRAEITPCELEALGMEDHMDEDLRSQLESTPDKFAEKVAELRARLEEIEQEVNGIKETHTDMEQALACMNTCCDSCKTITGQAEDCLESVKASWEKFQAAEDNMDQLVKVLEDDVAKGIPCSLKAELPNHLIAMKRKNTKKGFYALSDVKVIGCDSDLGTILGCDTRILVSGVDEEELCGLKFESEREFDLEDEEGKILTANEAVLQQGSRYQLTVTTGDAHKVRMAISVS